MHNANHILSLLVLLSSGSVGANSSSLFGLPTHLRIQKLTASEKKYVRLRKRSRMETERHFTCQADEDCSEYSRLQQLVPFIRAGGDSNENGAKADARKSNPVKAISIKQSATKRGTRTTGAGASKRNASIFLGQNAEPRSWTTAALAGDTLNRQVKQDDGNPMFGRLWAKLSDQGTLLLKIPSDNDEQELYVELSEQDNTRIQHEHESVSSRKSVSVKQITDSVSLNKITDPKSDPFIPLEGIYGIYDLPCSGIHAVLITRSEEIYSSPRRALIDVPLLELRRINSIEIVPLRSKKHHQIESIGDASIQLPSEEQLVEESRQLRLLRNSFKEHDFIFAVPRNLDNEPFQVVRDATHSLQRAFLDWSADNRGSSKKQHDWWIPYAEANKIKTRRRMVDPRFFWNEQPALALLHSSKTFLDKGEQSKTITRLLNKIIPVTSAFVGVETNIEIPSSHPSKINATYDQILISRRSKYRTGTRFTRRGADDTGAVANYAETEQICLVSNRNATNTSERLLSEVYSHVQTRGSIPLHWSSPTNVKAYRPRVFIGVDPTTQARGLRDHLFGELWWYASPIPKESTNNDQQVKLAMVNLIDKVRQAVYAMFCLESTTYIPSSMLTQWIIKHGDQGRLGETFDSVLKAVLDIYSSDSDQTAKKFGRDIQQLLDPSSVKHVWYDFHAECKCGRWDRLSNLLVDVSPILREQGYFCAIPTDDTKLNTGQWKIASLQDGVVRTNCMDCLDRTNVVQSMFGRYMLYQQLHDRIGLSASDIKRRRPLPIECVVGFKQRSLCLPWVEGESAHRNLWADNADAISRLYAGTPALKGDFTRTGVRTKKGALDDGVNSIQRYYLNNFIDADRQEGMDLLVGSTAFNEYPSELEMSRVSFLQELADDKRRGYNKNHARIKSAEDQGPKLNWLPGDLRYHMQVESHQSRLPLSYAATEEAVHAKKSSDFLMQVSSSQVNSQALHSNMVLHSIDRRVASDRPWWVDDSQPYGPENIPSPTQKTQIAAIIFLTARAPVFTTAMLIAIIALL
eukprot:scaffold67500_cov70-Cyclotella_meneghiniana.AAC.7